MPEEYITTHRPSLLIQFVHWPVSHTEPIHLTPGLCVLILNAIYTALNKLHVVLGQRPSLVRENVLHLQITENDKQANVNVKLYILYLVYTCSQRNSDRSCSFTQKV